jgi:hypothetical protein
MRERMNLIVAFAAVLTMSALGSRASAALTAFAVPSAASSDSWTSTNSGWSTFLNPSNPGDPFVSYSTVSTTSGMRWQMNGGIDTSVFPNATHIGLATGKLSNEMTQGQTFRFGLDARSGSFSIGNIGLNNSAEVGFSIGAGSPDYTYSDGDASFVDTGFPSSLAIDVQLTWTDTVNNTYSGKIAAIGNPSETLSWSGDFGGMAGTVSNPFDPANHINGYMFSNVGSPTNYFGLRYIEVGSTNSVQVDPSTLVPEPELVACVPLVVAGLIARRRS